MHLVKLQGVFLLIYERERASYHALRDARTVSVVGEVGKMGSSTTTTTSFFGESPGEVGPSNRSLD